ncbi:hypothetical protein C0J52_19460 [Blattella germanica]|nr:hypothetical protein C0J52_19460 [Blattella germanica]
MIKSVFTCASETWTLSSVNEHNLQCFERKIMRIYGPKCEDEISKCIKISRLKLAGHLMRMKEEEIPRKIITLQLSGHRGRGRPRLWWIDGVNGGFGNEELEG